MSDRLPPHSPEAEMAVIGCCLTSPVDCVPDCVASLTDHHFYEEKNRMVWVAINSMPPSDVDSISIRQILRDEGKFDVDDVDFYLSRCQDLVHSTANLPNWIGILVDKFTLRRVIQTATKAISDSYDAQDAVKVLDEFEAAALSIRPNQREENDIKSLVQQAIDKIEQRALKGNAITGISTGLQDLDRMTDGLHPGEMVVVAGYPGTGKTALSVNIAVNAAMAGIPAAIFSAEMRPVQLVVRSICSEARVNFHRVRNSDMGAMHGAVSRIAKAPIYIEQASGMTIGQVISSARRMKQRHGIMIAVVDYIQLLRGVGDNREQEISSISKGIKEMAMELGITALALSQLNDDGRLRESRAIGQDADTIISLKNKTEKPEPLVQPIELNIQKCRDGQVGSCDLTFLKTFTRFECVSNIPEPQQYKDQ